jgi:DNA-directed RNA polymerase subunit F
MFPRRTSNTLKQFRKDILEEKWPEVREAKEPKAIQEGTHSEKEETHRNGKLIRYHTNVSQGEKEDLRTVCGELLRPDKKPWKSQMEE